MEWWNSPKPSSGAATSQARGEYGINSLAFRVVTERSLVRGHPHFATIRLRPAGEALASNQEGCIAGTADENAPADSVTLQARAEAWWLELSDAVRRDIYITYVSEGYRATDEDIQEWGSNGIPASVRLTLWERHAQEEG